MTITLVVVIKIRITSFVWIIQNVELQSAKNVEIR